jgi:hypothetical protein
MASIRCNVWDYWPAVDCGSEITIALFVYLTCLRRKAGHRQGFFRGGALPDARFVLERVEECQ